MGLMELHIHFNAVIKLLNILK